jgi:excisionase family DNA binding protein
MSKTRPVQLLTIENIAELHQVSAKTVRRWISARELPAAKLGGQWRIHPDDAKRFFVERLYR